MSSRSGRWALPPLFFRRTLPLVNRHKRKVAWANIFSTRTNEFVVGILFEDVTGPTADSTNGKDWRVEIEGNSHHVIRRGGVEIDVWIKALLAHHHFFNLARHLIPLRITGSFANLF